MMRKLNLFMATTTRKPTSKTLTISQVKTRVWALLVLLVVCLIIVLPAEVNKGIDYLNTSSNIGIPRLPDKGFNLGLDLQGGAHLVYHAKTDDIAPADRSSAVAGVRDVIEKRVRGGLKVSEPVVQTTQVGDDYRIIVELPGVQNVNDAIQMIGKTPVLEFKEQDEVPNRDLTPAETKQMNDFNKAAEKKAQDALATIKKGMNFTEAVTKFSEDEATKAKGGDFGVIGPNELPEIYDWAKTHKDGDVSEVIKIPEGLFIIKRTSEKETADKTVSSAHLLICYKGVDATHCPKPTYTKDEAKAKIEEIKKEITVKNFAELAKKYSTDPITQKSGGDLGTLNKESYVPELSSAVWDAPVGTIVGPLESKYGFHLVYKKAEAKIKQYQVAGIWFKTKTKTDFVPPEGAWKVTGLGGKQLKRAEVIENPQSGQIQVSLKFDEEGTKLFSDITTRNVGKKIGIFIDGEPITNPPTVNEPINSGDAVISGSFSLADARKLAQQLNLGALPVGVELLSQQHIGASLGADSLHKSFTASIWGLIAIMIFMIVYYRLPGLLSVFSLGFYAILSLAIFKIMGVTLTLSGIAGFILSIGMAVDANILVFERLKEELQRGKSLQVALEEAFNRSWPSIRDGHITALISCVFLMWFGSGFIQGFAVILAAGTLINLFTAITITRTIMRFVFFLQHYKVNGLFLGHRKDS
jgi:protein-export membrane protein SecD